MDAEINSLWSMSVSQELIMPPFHTRVNLTTCHIYPTREEVRTVRNQVSGEAQTFGGLR